VQLSVYYADTDAGGVVYYANYLRWLEIGRTEYLASRGLSVARYAENGLVFSVVRVEIDYLSPAVLGDVVQIDTAVERLRRVRFTVAQRVWRPADGADLARALVTVACLNPERKAVPLPEELRKALTPAASAGPQHVA